MSKKALEIELAFILYGWFFPGRQSSEGMLL